MIWDTYLRHVDPRVNYEWSSEFLYLSNIVWFLFCLLIQYIKMLFTLVWWHIKFVNFPSNIWKKGRLLSWMWQHDISDCRLHLNAQLQPFYMDNLSLRVVHHYSIFYVDLTCIIRITIYNFLMWLLFLIN